MPKRPKRKQPSSTASNYFFSFRLVLLGSCAVGKSSLLARFVNDCFLDGPESTIGPVFVTRTVNLDGRAVTLEIWDTAGQERYESLAPMYYRRAQAAIVVYDITNPGTFQRAKMWVNELRERGSLDVVIALAGNKADLTDKRMVDYKEADAYAKENSLLLMETSAKTAMNVNEIFQAVAETIPKSQLVQEKKLDLGSIHRRQSGQRSGCKCSQGS